MLINTYGQIVYKYEMLTRTATRQNQIPNLLYIAEIRVNIIKETMQTMLYVLGMISFVPLT